MVEVAVAEVQTYPNEYNRDTENDFSDQEGEDINPITVSRSGRPIRAHFHFVFFA